MVLESSGMSKVGMPNVLRATIATVRRGFAKIVEEHYKVNGQEGREYFDTYDVIDDLRETFISDLVMMDDIDDGTLPDDVFRCEVHTNVISPMGSIFTVRENGYVRIRKEDQVENIDELVIVLSAEEIKSYRDLSEQL